MQSTAVYKRLGVGMLLSAATLLPAQANSTLQTIPRLEVPRYMGTWYEIAKYPNSFQKHCASETKAQYTPLPDGQIEVINHCREPSGKVSEAVGRVRQEGGAESPKLKVRFAPAWMSWVPMVWGDYWVIDLDSNYQLAAVSDPNREYLWILSRQPKVAADSYQALLARLQQKGFDLKKIELSPQP
jgi:apolipoprotein D and lipocalin family protein